jgi:hypothetical protein
MLSLLVNYSALSSVNQQIIQPTRQPPKNHYKHQLTRQQSAQKRGEIIKTGKCQHSLRNKNTFPVVAELGLTESVNALSPFHQILPAYKNNDSIYLKHPNRRRMSGLSSLSVRTTPPLPFKAKGETKHTPMNTQ